MLAVREVMMKLDKERKENEKKKMKAERLETQKKTRGA